MSRDPEIRELQRESLRLIIASEKVLTALEDHIALLRQFVATAQAQTITHSHEHDHTEESQ